jgi:hypothetical protein
MRPLSLAAIFASVASLLLGLVNALHHAGTLDATGAANTPLVTLLAESLIPGFIGFACLTAAWLCVAVALRKAP